MIKDIPIYRKFDTAGFLFMPYRAEFDEQKKTLQFIDNTLRDIVRDELVSRAVIWLLGYDARERLDSQLTDFPIRAQTESSHWETAWCVIHFLDARPILVDRYPSIVKEIDRRLCSDNPRINPLRWLLEEATPIEGDEGRVCWYGKEYDTAVVTLALLRARVEDDLELPNELKAHLDQLLPKALRWLYEDLERALETTKVDEEATIVLESLIYAEGYLASLLSEVRSSDNTSKREEFYSTLDRWLSYLEARRPPRKGNALMHLGLGGDEAYCLCRLVFAWQRVNKLPDERIREFIERAKSLLLNYIEFLEAELDRDQWSENLNRVWRLGTYVEACALVTRRSDLIIPVTTGVGTASAEVVLKVLSMVKNEFFTNGSIYHSVYPTMYFLRSLISIWKWPEAEKTIAQLYHDLLDKFVVRLTVERKENFDLRRELAEHERDLVNEKEQHELALAKEKEQYRKSLNRESKKSLSFLVFAIISLAVAILISISRFFSLSDMIQIAMLSAAVLGIIVGLVQVLWSHRPES